MRRSASLFATIAFTLSVAGSAWASVPSSAIATSAEGEALAAVSGGEMVRIQVRRSAGDSSSYPCTGDDGSCRMDLPSDPTPCSPSTGCATAGFLPTPGPSASIVTPEVPRNIGRAFQVPSDFLLDLPSPPPRV